MIPFLLWRVTKGHQEHNNGAGNSGTLSRLVGKVHLSLGTRAKLGSRYKRAYSCSMETLCSRYEALRENRSAKLATQCSTSNTQESNPVLPDTSMETGAGQDCGSPLTDQGKPLHADVLEQANRLIHSTYTLSKTILGLFVPLSELSVHGEVAKVLVRYWGALDASFRVSRRVNLARSSSSLL